jgi:hypothetical protein
MYPINNLIYKALLRAAAEISRANALMAVEKKVPGKKSGDLAIR